MSGDDAMPAWVIDHSWAVVAAIVYVPMVVEARRASRNERTQRARGGIEPPGDVYQLMRLVYPGAFLAMLVEGAIRGGPNPSLFAAGAIVFAAAKAVKWWAIVSLGRSWTFRVIVVPGASRIARGPYRWIRHPNYVGVLGELAGAAAMAGAPIAGAAGLVAFAGLLVRRIAVEDLALRALGPAAR
jgi:methyltransferase